jgi:hypothetical protein
MPIDPITWVIIAGSFAVGALTGAVVVTFWDEIKEWASRMLGYILDGINETLEVTSDALVYLVLEGSRLYKEIEVFSQNIYDNTTKRNTRREQVTPDKVPLGFQEQLAEKKRIQLMQHKN